MCHVVVEEGLGQESVERRPQRIAADHWLLSNTPITLSRRAQKDGRWTKQEFAGPKDGIVGGRNS